MSLLTLLNHFRSKGNKLVVTSTMTEVPKK
jgi:hypothetical protein